MSELNDHMTQKRSQSASNPTIDNPVSSESESGGGKTDKTMMKELYSHQLVKLFKDLQSVQVKIFEYLNHRVNEYD